MFYSRLSTMMHLIFVYVVSSVMPAKKRPATSSISSLFEVNVVPSNGGSWIGVENDKPVPVRQNHNVRSTSMNK